MSKYTDYRVKQFNGVYTIQIKVYCTAPGFPLPVPSEKWEDADIEGEYDINKKVCPTFLSLQDAYDQISEFKEGPIYHYT